jgi:hypothetical protein
VVALLAVVLLLALVVTAGSTTTSSNRDRKPVIQAINANSSGGARRLCGNTSTSKRPLERIAELRMQ